MAADVVGMIGLIVEGREALDEEQKEEGSQMPFCHLSNTIFPPFCSFSGGKMSFLARAEAKMERFWTLMICCVCICIPSCRPCVCLF